jgi:membrane-bound serine protease (ClpP class)
MEPWAWAILLLLLGLGLVILEVFIPSSGVLGFLAFCSLVGAAIMGFTAGPGTGLAVLGTIILGLPVIIVAALHYWPHTPIGRRILLNTPGSEEVLPDNPRRKQLKKLIGRVGRAKTKMLPSGVITVDGRTVDAVSDGMAIEPGQKVRVIEVRGNRVLVRCVDEETPSEADVDPMARPIDSISGDPFQDFQAPPA